MNRSGFAKEVTMPYGKGKKKGAKKKGSKTRGVGAAKKGYGAAMKGGKHS